METCAPPKIFLYTALPCEAKPLIAAYKLNKDSAHSAFNIFKNDDIALTVTGIGKCAMAAGVAYCRALFLEQRNPVMLNIGVAGHKEHSTGSLFLADKLTDNETYRCFYPPLAFTPPCATATVMTFAKPQNTYPASALCDMEATGFYEAATRFSTGELCQCLKIISDNENFPAKHVDAQKVTSMITEKMDVINSILTSLTTLADSLNLQEPIELGKLLTRYHFTVNEQIQLKKLLNRWRLVTGEDFSNLPIDAVINGKEFIWLLNRHIDGAEFML